MKDIQILIAEDDFVIRKVLNTHLSNLGETTLAVNGREAVEAALTKIEEGRPFDLICLDIMMPEMNGQEALRKIRIAEKEAGVDRENRSKIIMTSALNESKEMREALINDSDGYLVKPIKKLDILRIFENV